MLLDIILSRGTDFNAKCQIRCRWLGGFFMLIRWLIFWWYGYMKPEYFIIPEKECLCVCVCVCVRACVCVSLHIDPGMVHPGASRPVLARLERLTVLPQEVTQKSSRNVYEHLQSPKTCGLTWLSPVCNSTVGKVLLLLEGFEGCVCACVCIPSLIGIIKHH